MKYQEREDTASFFFTLKDVVVLIGLLTFTIMALWPILFTGDDIAPGIPAGDGRTQWYPWRAYAANSIRNGVLPLWNPYVLCGVPFVGGFQSALFYPPNLLFLMTSVAIAARLSVLLHIWLSLIFTYLFARSLRCSRVPSIVATLTFGFCGAQLLRVPAGHWGVTCAIVWLPLILLCVERLFLQPGRLIVVIGAFAVGLQVLSGMPQYVLISCITAGGYSLLRSFGSNLTWKARLNRWSMVGGMFVLGAAISAIQLLPGLAAASGGARSLPLRPEWAEVFSFPPEGLLTLLVPGFFGAVGGGPYWGRWLYWEMNAYVGMIGVVLAVYALVSGDRKNQVAWFGILAILMLLLAFGRHTPFQRAMTFFLPIRETFRGSAKFLLPFSLSLAMLAGVGAEVLLRNYTKHWKRAALIAGGLAFIVATLTISSINAGGVVAAVRDVVMKSGESFYDPKNTAYLNMAHSVISGGIFSVSVLVVFAVACLVLGSFQGRRGVVAFSTVMILLASSDMLHYSRDFVGRWATFEAKGSIWPPNIAEYCRIVCGKFRTRIFPGDAPNDCMLEQIRTAEGIEPNPPARYHSLFQTGLGRDVDLAPSFYIYGKNEIPLNVASVGYRLTPKAYQIPKDMDVVWTDGEWRLAKLDSAVPRVRVVYRSIMASSPREALALTLSCRPNEEVVLEELSMRPASSHVPCEPFVSLDEDEPNRIRISTALPQAGWLVLSDSYSPGWIVEVDGKPGEILHADYAFKAVALPSGLHTVIFQYKPASLYYGLWVSMVALVLGSGLVLSAMSSKKSAPPKPDII